MMLAAVLSLGGEIPGGFLSCNGFLFLEDPLCARLSKEAKWQRYSSGRQNLGFWLQFSSCPSVIREIQEKLGQENFRWRLPTRFQGTGPMSGVPFRHPMELTFSGPESTPTRG